MSTEVDFVSIPVIEEELTLARKTLETGRVRVRTVPQERTDHVSEPLSRTDIVVEHVPRDEEIERIPPLRDEDGTIVVSVVEERLVKRLFLVEEVRLTRRTSTKLIDQEITLRSQHVVVEREGTTKEE